MGKRGLLSLKVREMAEQSHYEILSEHGGGWNAEAIVPDKAEAIERANDLKRQKGNDAVKVMYVSFNNAVGAFVEQEILLLGARPSPARAYGDGLDAGSPCRSMEQIFSLQSRQAIRRVMRQWLDAQRLTAVELLHLPEYINKFEASGTMLQSAVQRTAMAQAGAYKVDVNSRQRELYSLFDQISAKAKAMWRAEKIPLIQNDDLDDLVSRLGNEIDKDKEYIFNASLANWLRRYKSAPEKLMALLEMATRTKQTATIGHLDGFLTDFLEDANAIAKLIGDQSSLGEAVLRLAGLVNPGAAVEAVIAVPVAVELEDREPGDEIYDVAQRDDEIPEHPAIEEFRAMVRRGSFPKCRKSLVYRIEQTLNGNRTLTGNGVLAEARLLRLLHDRLCDADGNMNFDTDLVKAFEDRSHGYVSSNSIGNMLEGELLPLKRISILLEAELGIYSTLGQRRIGDYILAILNEPENQATLRHPETPPAIHMRNLGGIQRLIMKSHLSDAQKEESSLILDDICTEILGREQILAKIADRSSSNIDECMSILKLCAAGAFTEVRAADIARQRATAVMRAPGFAEAFLRRANGKAEMGKMLVELETLMTRAGIVESSLLGVMAAAHA